MERMLPVGDAARALGVSVDTLRRWERAGRITMRRDPANRRVVTLTVFAAASLTNAFTELAKTYQSQHPGWKVRLNFAGSDALAAQIEQGAHADTYAAASPKYPEQLQGEKLLGGTTNFATNTLVL